MTENCNQFSTRMRKATRKIHSISDTLVNAKFAISLRNETVWGGGLFVFYHIFAFLEDAKERLNMDELNKLFVHNILYRKEAFEEDLKHYLGDDWTSTPKSPALENYLKHLHHIEKENPQLLLAYVYHLYLGLLSGGQILAKKRKMFGGSSKNSSYEDKVTDFQDVDIGKLKKDFRHAMDLIADEMSEEKKQMLIEESNRVFLMNNMIVNSVGGQNRVINDLLYKVFAVLFVLLGVYLLYKMNH